jgi:hypothetical protein
MTEIGLHRGLAGFGAFLCVRLGVRRNTTNGRQGKSVAFGRAHVVGFVEHFRHFKNWPCWRSARNIQQFQYQERHRLSLETSPSP